MRHSVYERPNLQRPSVQTMSRIYDAPLGARDATAELLSLGLQLALTSETRRPRLRVLSLHREMRSLQSQFLE
jgi:hypothetical protein